MADPSEVNPAPSRLDAYLDLIFAEEEGRPAEAMLAHEIVRLRAALAGSPAPEPPPFGTVPFGTMFVPGPVWLHGDNEWHEFDGPVTVPPKPAAGSPAPEDWVRCPHDDDHSMTGGLCDICQLPRPRSTGATWMGAGLEITYDSPDTALRQGRTEIVEADDGEPLIRWSPALPEGRLSEEEQ